MGKIKEIVKTVLGATKIVKVWEEVASYCWTFAPAAGFSVVTVRTCGGLEGIQIVQSIMCTGTYAPLFRSANTGTPLSESDSDDVGPYEVTEEDGNDSCPEGDEP